MNYFETIEPGNYYHIYNKAIGNDLLFKREDDYIYFFKKLKRYIFPVAEILSFCLIPNHFHLMTKMKEVEESEFESQIEIIKKAFSNFFNSYSKSFNKIHNRKGKLFNLPFKRIKITDESYFTWLIFYIHRNPVHHGLTRNIEDYRYSSYHAILNENPNVNFSEVLEWFGGKNEFIDFHKLNMEKNIDGDIFFED
jgi:putative transposase